MANEGADTSPGGVEERSGANSTSWVLIATILASSMAFIDGSALNVALPALQADLGASGTHLLWIVNAYMLMLGALTLTGGSLGDHLGRKRVFMGGIALFSLASLTCGLAPNPGFLIGARVVQGIGGALMIPGSLALITDHFSDQGRGRAIGTWSAVTTLVTVVGPVLGGPLADLGFWRGVFLINLPLAIVSLLILHARVPTLARSAPAGGIDFPGASLATLGLAAVSYGFISAPDRAFQDPITMGSIVGGAVILLAFFVVEWRSPHPMLPLGLFRSRTFLGANLLTLFLYGALSAFVLFLSLDLVQALGFSQSQAGLAFTPFALLLAALSRWAGGLVDRYGPRLPLIVGPAVAGLGIWLTSRLDVADNVGSYWGTLFLPIAVFGVGMGITVAPLSTTVMSSVNRRHAGTASGVNNAISRIAGVLAVAILGSMALTTFNAGVQERIQGIQLSPQARAAVQAQARAYGQAQVPPEVPPEHVDEIRAALRGALIDSNRRVMVISAGLGALSAVMAALLVEQDWRASEAS
jgi:EmrB/QacA subfamily drug resistance transporter